MENKNYAFGSKIYPRLRSQSDPQCLVLYNVHGAFANVRDNGVRRANVDLRTKEQKNRSKQIKSTQRSQESIDIDTERS